MTIARYDPDSRAYRVEGVEDGYSALSFSHPWSAARIGCIVAGEIATEPETAREEERSPTVSVRVAHK